MKLLLLLYVRPMAGMSQILDEGRPAPAVLLAGGAAVLLLYSLGRSVSLMTVVELMVILAAVFVPVSILAVNLFHRLGGSGVVLSREYLPLLICTALAWTASVLPLAGITFLLPAWWLFAAAGLYFLFLAVCALRTAMGAGIAAAALAVLLAVAASGAAAFLRGILHFLASPLLIFWAYMLFQSDLRTLGSGLRSRQSFRRHLEASSINPHDADAHYQLGLIYQQRRQLDEAAARFRKSISIDREDADSHFQLARILRQQNKPEEALPLLERVAALDDRHALSDIWRETGATLLELGRVKEAERALEKYVERRGYDPEGLFWYGKALQKLGRKEEAAAAFKRCVEAADTMPRNRASAVRPWRRLAADEL